MKILIAPNAFKDSLTALQASEAMRRGVIKVFPDANIICIPIADGGDGTLGAICSPENTMEIEVSDPLGRKTRARLGVSRNGNSASEPRTCVIEVAQASGLALLASNERNPWLTSSYGTGELIRHALDLGAKAILIGLGGSATNDCGAGLLAALGAKFLDQSNQIVQPTGGSLGKIHRIDLSRLDERLTSTSLIGLCDVNNPLTGPNGASKVYGPQKGADPEMIQELEANLLQFGTLLETITGKSILNRAGSGAAGGIGAAILALGGSLQPGFAAISELLGLKEQIKFVDFVITGEGRTDSQTGSGKGPAGIIELAKASGKPVIVISGAIVSAPAGIPAFSTSNGPQSLEFALLHAAEALESTTTSVLGAVSLGMQIKV